MAHRFDSTLSALRKNLMLGATSWAALSGTAFAQDSASADAGVGDIVVTAERRETHLQDTPIAISAFDSAALSNANVTSVRDLAGLVPNLFVPRATISHTTQTYFLRGVGEGDPIQEPALAVYVDDIYQPRQLGAMSEFNDVERIEVLRGPQGTLYGRNSAAGALRIITRTPGEDSYLNLSVAGGNLEARDARVSIGGPIIEDRLYGSLSFTHRDRAGATYNPTLGRDVNRIDLDALRARLRWTPTEPLDVQLTLNALRDRSDTRGYVPVTQPGGGFNPRLTFAEVEPLQDLDQVSSSLRVSYEISPTLEFRSITGYGGFNLNPVNYDNDGRAGVYQRNQIHYNDQYVTQEFQLNGEIGPVTYTTGFFFLTERFSVRRDSFSSSTGAVPAVGTRAQNITYTDALAVFGEATWALNERLSLTLGARATEETKEFDYATYQLDINRNVIAHVGTFVAINGVAEETWSAVTPKFSAQYEWTPDLLVYFSASQGFKAGGFDNRAAADTSARLPFDPEEVTSFEVGAKADWFGHALRTNVALFYNDYKDLQVSYHDPAYFAATGITSRRGNAGQATTYGVELETSARPTENLRLNFNVAYLFAEFDEYLGVSGAGTSAAGNRLTNSPEWTASAAISYDVTALPVPGLVRLGLDAQYQSSVFSSAQNRWQDRSPGQTFVNGSITWLDTDSGWSLGLSGRNLLDSDDPVSSSFTNANIFFKNYPDPRTWLLTLRYQR